MKKIFAVIVFLSLGAFFAVTYFSMSHGGPRYTSQERKSLNESLADTEKQEIKNRLKNRAIKP
jgi:hypothetical protein